MPKIIQATVVGYGLAGKTFHAPLIQATEGLCLRSVVSSDPAKVYADIPDIRVDEDISTALADPEIDLVVIATPDSLHKVQAIAALDAGKAVVVDKPFALTFADASEMTAHAKETGKMLSVFHNRRWDSDFLTLKKLIGAGELGEIMQFESHFDRFRPAVVDRWKERPGAGVWQDLGPHLIDQALQLFGRPLAVYADIAEQKEGALTGDYVHAILRYPRLRVILHASQMTAVSDLRFAVHGTQGSFIKYGNDPQEGQSKAGIVPGTGNWGIDPRPGQLTRITGDGSLQQEPAVSEVGNYQAYYAGIRDCIAHGHDNPVTLQSAMDVMLILELGAESARQRREVALP